MSIARATVTEPHDLFRRILQMIDELRPRRTAGLHANRNHLGNVDPMLIQLPRNATIAMLPLALAGLGEPMIRTLAFVSVGLLASIPVFAQGAPAPKGI